MQVGGIVLCGGHSRRMGRPKAWLPVGEEYMLTRILRLLVGVVGPVVVVAARNQELPPLPEDVPVVRDEHEDRGPMQGLASGLKALRGRADAAYVSSCDAPLLRPAFVRRLIDRIGEHTACVPLAQGYPHPLPAVYRLDAVSVIEELLAQGQLRLSTLLDMVPVRLVQPDEFADIDPQLDSLRNINTPTDYEAVLRLVRTFEKNEPDCSGLSSQDATLPP